MTISIQQAQIATLYIGYFSGPADPAGLVWSERGSAVRQSFAFFAGDREESGCLVHADVGAMP